MKRIISLVLVCILLLQAVPMQTFAAGQKEYNISSFKELQDVAKKASNASSTTYFVYYNGSKSLVISQNLTLPKNLHLYVHAQKLVVNKGVTLRSKNSLSASSIEINGTAYTYNCHAINNLTVNGKLYLQNTLYIENGKSGKVKGVNNIVFGDWTIHFWMDAKNTDEMISNLNKALTSPHERYMYRMQPTGDFVFNKSVTLPQNSFMTDFRANSVTINSGCTLTINTSNHISKPLTVKGKLVNKGTMNLFKKGASVTVKSGGSYTDKGNIWVDSSMKPSEVIKGINLKNYFEVNDGNGILLWSPAFSRTNVTAKNVSSSGKIKLSWDHVYGAEKYEIYRATSKSGEFTLLGTTTNTSYTTSGTAGKTYYYKVRAVSNTGDKSLFSEVVSRTVDLPRPEVTVRNDSASGKIKLSWEKIDGAAKYEIYRATSKSGEYKLLKTTTSTSYTTGGTAGKTYYYKVKAIHSKSAANSAYSEVVSRTRDLARPEVSIKLKSGDPRLSWEKIDGVKEYAVYRATSKNGDFKKIKTVTGAAFTDTTAKAGKTYYYKVKAIHKNTSANSANSSVVSIKAK